MSDIQYNVQFEKLCSLLQIGDIVGTPESISGGFLHRMYALETTQGKYAIKALNPHIMLRPVARQNFINSERIVHIVANNRNIPAIPAKIIRGTCIQEIDNQCYLVFDWVEGRSLKPNEINRVHCLQISAVLAEIHMTDFIESGISIECSDHEQHTDWNYYLQKGQENRATWVDLLLEHLDMLYDWNVQANHSAKVLSSERVISHRDLDPKNVMWNQDKPMIIDWEAAGYINPMQDLIETAIYWSENEIGNIDKDRFLAFIVGYKERNGTVQANWRMVLVNGFLGKLGWLEYNLKRSLWIECTDDQEQQMGTAEVTATINALRRYAEMIDEIEVWLYIF